MKARRRRELKQNVLDTELGKVVEFFRKYGTYMVWGGAIAAFVLLVVVLIIRSSRQGHLDIHARYNQAMTVDTISLSVRLKDLKDLVEQDTDRRIAAMACVAVGDLSALQLATVASSITPIERKHFRDEAETYYHKAIRTFTDRPRVVGRARLGLALLAESRRDFDAAEAEYKTILATSELQAEPLAEAAAKGLKTLDELRLAVAMATTAPAPRKKEEP